MQRSFSQKLLAGVALACVSSYALAADLPAREYSKAPSPLAPEPVYTWTGLYIGANAGYGWATTSSSDSGGSGSNDLNGFVGGGQIGYNWQAGNLVLGVEGDFQGSAQKRSDTVLGVTVDQKIPWFATARGRIGYAADSLLIYATGGAAWVNYKVSGTYLGVTVSDDASKTAWTVGGGVEWMFAPKWSVKAEYLYMDTGDRTVTLFGVPFSGRAKDNVVRVGANFHF